MGNKCSDLKEIDDPCEIGNCIDILKGLKGTCSSSDTWIVKFKENTKYNGIDVYYAFMKISIYVEPSPLYYELCVYKDVTTKLLNYNICPNYVRCYATSVCTFDNIMNILNNGIEHDYEMNKERLNRACYLMQTERCHMRPSINDVVDEKYDIDSSQFYYNFIINESMSDSISFEDFIYYAKNKYEGDEYTKIMLIVIFQILCALYGLFLSKTNHNDLHLNNIFITKIPLTLNYQINDVIYTLHTDYLVKIYDYDASYCTFLGPNDFRSTFKPKKDIDFFLPLLKPHFPFKKIVNEMNEDYDIETYLYKTANVLDLKNEYKEGVLYTLNKELFEWNGKLKNIELPKIDDHLLYKKHYTFEKEYIKEENNL